MPDYSSSNYSCFGFSQDPPAATLVGLGDHSVTLSVYDSTETPQQCTTTLSVICSCPSIPTLIVNDSCIADLPVYCADLSITSATIGTQSVTASVNGVVRY